MHLANKKYISEQSTWESRLPLLHGYIFRYNDPLLHPFPLLICWLLCCFKPSPIVPLYGCQCPTWRIFRLPLRSLSFKSTHSSNHSYCCFRRKEEEWKWTTSWDSGGQSCATISGLLLTVGRLLCLIVASGTMCTIPSPSDDYLNTKIMLQDKKPSNQARQREDKDINSGEVWQCKNLWWGYIIHCASYTVL